MLHALVVMSCAKRKSSIQKGNREQVLHVDIGHVAVVHNIDAIIRRAYNQLLDIAGFDLVFLHQRVKRGQCCLHRRPDGPVLDLSVHEPTLATGA